MNLLLVKTLLLSVSCGLAATVVLAKPRRLEVYSANEAGEPTSIIQRVPGPASVALPQAGLPRTTQPKAVMQPPAQNRLISRPTSVSTRTYLLPKGDFDPVPPEHADSIASRLKLVELLITRYGRAYDYRIHTNRELEAIVAELETKEDRAAALSP